MSASEVSPNDPELFSKLVDGITSLTARSAMFFNIDNVRYAYPDDPDNIRQMGDSVFALADAHGRNTDGRVMSGISLEPDGVDRRVYSYLFGEAARRQYGRIGELAIEGYLKAPGIATMQVDLYWVEQDGTAWTRTEERFGGTSPASQQASQDRRQVTDFELDVVVKIVQAVIPSW